MLLMRSGVNALLKIIIRDKFQRHYIAYNVSCHVGPTWKQAKQHIPYITYCMYLLPYLKLSNHFYKTCKPYDTHFIKQFSKGKRPYQHYLTCLVHNERLYSIV